MPSKSVGGRKLAGGFDSRPPPLRDSYVDQHGCDETGRQRVGEGGVPQPEDPVTHTSLRPDLTKSSLAAPSPGLDKSSRSRSENWTSLDVRWRGRI